jgi:hypothetical protein
VTIADLLLARQGIASLAPGDQQPAPALLQAVDVELAALGYALSTRLRDRLATLAPDDLARVHSWLYRVLAEGNGAAQKHEPLFRDFPRGVPENTFDLWVRKFLIYYVQAPDQPCLFCRRIGTTHVLNPCLHVICDRCFDGANYSACPACEHHVDRHSPFFKPSGIHLPSPAERVTFTLIDLGEGDMLEARRLFLALCSRRQALSPADGDVLVTILGEYREAALSWLPDTIPVRETCAVIFGTLLRDGVNPGSTLGAAKAHLKTATDVLRLLAAYSGADPGLQGQVVYLATEREIRGRRTTVRVPRIIHRFEMARLGRPLRRGLLQILEGLGFERLIEDLLRHRSYWIWAGEFLHPFEHAARYPAVVLAFAILRGARPGDDALGAQLREDAVSRDIDQRADGAYRYRPFYSRLEAAATRADSVALKDILSERPGELARHLDHALRVTLAGDQPVDPLVSAYLGCVDELPTPLLVTLRSALPQRLQTAPIRLFWPKGQVAKGVSAPDKRSALPATVVEPLVEGTEREIIRRFAGRQHYDIGIVDRALTAVVAPFNERTASHANVVLPRGSRVPVPEGRILRLFLHWCQPERGERTTDLDLSVAFYDADWHYLGVCSYYQLKFSGKKAREIALSAGDLRDGPYPDGASEFVDLRQDRARAEGIRYAVMVVSAYAGMPFSALERAYAGAMVREDEHGAYFDPRTVALKFDLQGENGVFLPMVVDLDARLLHWLDVYSTGQFALNNVETSRAAIQSICPAMITYFGSGARASIYEVALLHAAARCEQVYVRGDDRLLHFSRGRVEDRLAFYRRLVIGQADEKCLALPALASPTLAVLYQGDIDLPSGSACYALFRERQPSVMAASDLLS